MDPPDPGTTKLERLQANIGAVDIKLTPDDLLDIDMSALKVTIKGARYPDTLEKRKLPVPRVGGVEVDELRDSVRDAIGHARDDHPAVAAAHEDDVVEGLCLIQMGTVLQEVCMETIRQRGAKVIPRFR
jgi:hypothetical protein